MVIVFFKAPTEQAESWQGQWHETNTPSADCNREKKKPGGNQAQSGDQFSPCQSDGFPEGQEILHTNIGLIANRHAVIRILLFCIILLITVMRL